MRVQLSLLLIFLAAAMSMDARTRRSSTKGKTKVTVSAKRASAKKTPVKRAKAKGRRTTQTARRAPRQSAPTPERYMEIQQALADKGFFTGEVNGSWGPDSVDALKRFQAAQNLSVDGKLGALSLIALGLGPKRDSMAQFAGKPESNP